MRVLEVEASFYFPVSALISSSISIHIVVQNEPQ